ncbi:MAG: RloB domain-containing protein [Sphaerochaetaceae bacterium]|jgi:hypothetical protein|nr:RloB family protein [Sphaerochaetaceae bacterium]NLO59569.1 RloB domain-containing protein [Spirochaetales bacterium]MDD2405037.1 RloB domain-containing protein [Sphaerochaetaceae bacterium]MDD3669938.1 RloB domain-containing protein [Sphaerochaetaceae bacterium]MDD4259539.1 RloB domain-containing protein [Sphaerochaetaceae bacterium]
MKRKKIHQEPKKAMLIVTSTEAEALYFSQMRKDCRYTNLTVRWAEHADSLESLISIAAKLRTAGKFDSVWALYGFDAFEATLDQLRSALETARIKKIGLAWNNPGLPLWYLLHIQTPRLPITDNKVIENSLRGHLPKFSSGSEYLLNEGSSLHLKLFPLKAQAVVNAGTYNSLVERRNGGLQATNMVKLLNEITSYCGLADVSHNQKLIGLKK